MRPVGPVDLSLRGLDNAWRWARLLRGRGRIADPSKYFEGGGPRDERWWEDIEHINDDLIGWLDPGEIATPAPETIDREGEFLRFPSPRPSGAPSVDRVVLRLLDPPTGPDARPDVAVLFHPWIYIDAWKPVDHVVAPLTQRFRVASMVAPHHLERVRPGYTSGEGMLNANPLRLFEGIRQFIADHLASVALLQRDHGISRVVVLGYSLGGYVTMFTRLHGVHHPMVAVCVTNCYSRGVLEGIATRRLRPRLWESGFTEESFVRATRSLHLERHAERLGGEELTWMYARDDRIEPADSLASCRCALSPERVVELPGGGHATAALFRQRIAREVELRAGGAG